MPFSNNAKIENVSKWDDYNKNGTKTNAPSKKLCKLVHKLKPSTNNLHLWLQKNIKYSSSTITICS